MLSDSSKNFIYELPYKRELEREGVKITMLHYPMNSSNEYIDYIKNSSSNNYDSIFSNYNSDIIIYGHSHTPSLINGNKKTYINCGSLGCPHKFLGKAKGGIITIDKGIFDFEMVYASYDINKVIEKINSVKYSDFEIIKSIFYGA